VKDDPGAVDRRRELVQRLVSLRKSRGLTQTEVARRMGIVQGSVQSIERGDDPRISTIFRYARALGAQVTFNVTDA